MGSSQSCKITKRVPYPSLSPSPLAPVMSLPQRTKTQSTVESSPSGHEGYINQGRQDRELDVLTINDFRKSHAVELFSSFNSNSKISKHCNNDITTNRNIDNTTQHKINITTNCNIDVNKENIKLLREDIVTKMNRVQIETENDRCKSCRGHECTSCILQSSDSYTKDNSPVNVVAETNEHTRLVPTIYMLQVSMEAPCFQELPEVDQATGCFLNENSSNDDFPVEKRCQMGHPFRKPVNNQLSTDVLGRPSSISQSLENDLLLEEEDDLGCRNVGSLEDEKDLCCRISDSFSKSFIGDTSVPEHADLECGIDMHEEIGEPCDLIEITRHSVFVDARTGQLYDILYDSRDKEGTVSLTDSEKTSHFHRHKSVDSTNSLANSDPDSPGLWPIFELSPTEQASKGMSYHFHEAQSLHGTATVQTESCNGAVPGQSESFKGTVPGHSQCLQGTATGQSESLHGTATGHSESLHDTATGYSQSLQGTVHGHFQPLHGTATGQSESLHGTATGYSQSLHDTATGYSQSLQGTVPGHSQSLHGTATGQSESLHGTVPVQVHSSSSTAHDQPFHCAVSEQIQASSGTIREQTRRCQNQQTNTYKLSKSYPGMSASNNEHTATSNTRFLNSHHSNLMGHPVTSPHLPSSPELHCDADAIHPDPFPTQPNPSCPSQTVQDRLRALYHNRRGFSVNYLDLNSMRTLTASHLKIDEHGSCVVCRNTAERKLSLREFIPITSSTRRVTATNQTTTTICGSYEPSLSIETSVKQPAEPEKGNKQSPNMQTPDQVNHELSRDWKVDPLTYTTQALNYQEWFWNCPNVQSSRNRSESSNSCSDRRMGSQAQSDDWGECGSEDVCGGSSSLQQGRKEIIYRGPGANSGGACSSVVQKDFHAYLCVAEDNLSLFGLPFHRKLEDWDLKIFLAERDLEPGVPKFETMAKCIEERCNGKIIVILSESYPDSQECLFLTYFAKTLDPDSKHKNIIPVIIDKEVEIPKVLQGLSFIYYNYVVRNDWLKTKIMSAIFA